jgi:hypothetical protein
MGYSTKKIFATYSKTVKINIMNTILDLLERLNDYMDDRKDVEDGDYGVPRPNIEMSFSTEISAAMEEYKRQPARDGWVETTPETNEKFGESEYVLGLESDGGTPVVCWYNSKMGSWYVAHHLAPSIAINIIKWKPLTT